MPNYPNIHLGATGKRVKPLQTGIDRVLGNRKFAWRKVPIDGTAGHHTFKAAHLALWLMGASDKQLRKVRNGEITDHAYRILTGQRARSDAMKKRDVARRPDARKLRELHKQSQEMSKTGLATWGGVTLAAWIVGKAKGPDGTVTNWLQKAVDHGWKGYVTSGFRDPAYSEHLCYVMCGAPSCPGRCAGRSSNHSGYNGSPPGWGAIDVTDYYNFGRIMAEIGAPLKNGLPTTDPVHFSVTGN